MPHLCIHIKWQTLKITPLSWSSPQSKPKSALSRQALLPGSSSFSKPVLLCLQRYVGVCIYNQCIRTEYNCDLFAFPWTHKMQLLILGGHNFTILSRIKHCLELLALTLALSFVFETTDRTHRSSGLSETKIHIIYTQIHYRGVADEPQVEYTRALKRLKGLNPAWSSGAC